MKALLALGTIVAVSGCIPSRDNAHDPAVRPDPRFSVFVDGNPSTSGGRHQRWELDGSASRDPEGSLGAWTMALSSSGECNGSAEGWEEIASGNADGNPLAIFVSSTMSSPAYAPAFASRLAAISDFDESTPERDESGVVRRTVRLAIGSAHTCADIIVINRPPAVSLGPDLRTAPGGRWWTVGDAGVPSVLDADPAQVELSADIQDPDPGDAEAIDASSIVWHVSGYLATVLDVTPRDGIVDDDKFADDSHRVVRFDSPLIPARSRVEVSIGDLPGLIAATDEARVDVLSSHWVEDVASLRLSRLASGTFDRATGNATVGLLAESGGKVLAMGGGRIQMFDQRLNPLVDSASGSFFVSTNPGEVAAVTNGRTNGYGWWVMDSAGDRVVYALDFVLASSAASMTSVEGTAASDFTAEPRMVAGRDGRAWVLGERDGNPLEPRLYRLDDYNVLGAAVDAPGPSLLAPDGDGGVWACGDSLVHIAEDGTELSNDPSISGCTSLSYDARADLLWIGAIVSMVGARDTFVLDGVELRRLYIGADGAVSDGTGTAVLPRLLGLSQFTGFRRIDATGDVVESVPYTESLLDGGFVVVEGGSLMTHVSVEGEERLVWMEAGDGGDLAAVDVVLPEGDQPVAFAVDPVTGFLWMWDPACTCVREVAAGYGERASPPFTVPANPRVAVAIDPAPAASGRRTFWLAWSDATSGGLAKLEIPERFGDAIPALSEVPVGGISLSSVAGMDVVPGDRLCIASNARGEPPGPQTHGLVFDVSANTATAVKNSTGLSLSMAVAAAPRQPITGNPTGNGCWWFQSGVGAFQSPDIAVFASDAGTEEVSLQIGASRTIYGVDVDHWARMAHAPSTAYATGGFADDKWMVLKRPSPATFSNTLLPATRGGVTSDLYEVAGIWEDRFYRQKFVSIGSANVTGAVPGRILRLDENLQETASYGGFVMPRVRGAR